jgi:hypothetical protein
MVNLFEGLAETFAKPDTPDDPISWSKNTAGIELWSKQKEILDSVRNNKFTAVQSAHGTGKSMLASILAAWWVDTHPYDDSIVISTAPSANQVHGILWENIRRIARDAKLPGTVQLSDNWVVNGRLVGQGRKPQDYSDHVFQGIHRKYVLFILDEACGINASLWNAARTNTTSEHCRVLAIGNPDDPASEFANVCRAGSGWNTIKISLWDSPNFSGEEVSESAKEHLVDNTYLEMAKTAWGEGSPIWKSKVDGEFPESDEFTVCPINWVLAAFERYNMFNDMPQATDVHPDTPPPRKIFGVDVARYGSDKTVVCTRVGNVLTKFEEFTMMDTIDTANILMARMNKSRDKAVIDMTGIGSGVYDVLKRRGYKVEGFNAGAKTKQLDASRQLGFTRVRSAAWWKFREALDPSKDPVIAFPPIEKLQGDLTSPKWEQVLNDQIQVESKDDLRLRLGRSTDYADAAIMAWWSRAHSLGSIEGAAIGWIDDPDKAGEIEGSSISWDLDDDWRERIDLT